MRIVNNYYHLFYFHAKVFHSMLTSFNNHFVIVLLEGHFFRFNLKKGFIVAANLFCFFGRGSFSKLLLVSFLVLL